MLDIIIIGSGPAGLSAAIYGRRANLDVLVVEKEYEGTGQVAESGSVDNYLGLPGQNGYDLGERFRQHAKQLGVAFLEQEVTGVREIPSQETDAAKGWEISLREKESLNARTVIYAAGASHRRLSVPGEERFLGKGVSYCAICDGSLYRNKTVAVIGGGDTALEDALYLSRLCSKVYLVHRREKFRGAEGTAEQVKKRKNIELILNAEAAELTGEKKLTELVLKDGRKLSLDGVFVAVGMIPRTGLLQDLVRLDEGGYVMAEESGATERPGLFVAGDVRSKRLRQIITAAADGANAATAAAEYIEKEIRER